MRWAASSDLADAARAFVDEARAPGVAVARVTADEAWAAAVGEARPGEPLTVEHGQAWFSVTKLLTMTAVLKAVEAAQLQLDDPISKWLPELARGPQPSLRDLLTHRAGLPEPIPWGWLGRADDPRPDPEAFASRWLGRCAPAWWRTVEPIELPPPRYSNSSYLTLGVVLGRVYGRAPHRVLQSTLRQLGLSRTGLSPGPDAKAACGHTRFGSPFDLAMWVAGARRVSRGRSGPWRVLRPVRMEVAAAGGAFGPLLDLAQFARCWLTGSGLGLSRELIEAAYAEPGPWSLGFARLGGDRFSHEGSGLGFVSRLEIDRLRGCAHVLFVNRSGALRPEWPELGALAEALSGVS